MHIFDIGSDMWFIITLKFGGVVESAILARVCKRLNQWANKYTRGDMSRHFKKRGVRFANATVYSLGYYVGPNRAIKYPLCGHVFDGPPGLYGAFIDRIAEWFSGCDRLAVLFRQASYCAESEDSGSNYVIAFVATNMPPKMCYARFVEHTVCSNPDSAQVRCYDVDLSDDTPHYFPPLLKDVVYGEDTVSVLGTEVNCLQTYTSLTMSIEKVLEKHSRNQHGIPFEAWYKWSTATFSRRKRTWGELTGLYFTDGVFLKAPRGGYVGFGFGLT